MGEEIEKAGFEDQDFRDFDQRLKLETDLLEIWFNSNRFAGGHATGGFELEAWLVDESFRPSARNDEFLERLNDELVAPELSKFNLEFNTPPHELKGRALRKMEENLSATWRRAGEAAAGMGLKLMMIGILPTIRNADLSEENMSNAERYRAINEQIFRIRKGKPLHLKIEGEDTLESEHMDVMLEAGATSFQVHLKVNQRQAADFYNAAKIASAPLVAISANSPYLFGKNLWAETRIPLFETAVSVGKWDYCERVTFGVRHIDDSLVEVFVANRQRYPSLLPRVFDDPPKAMRHLRLHNGTIWRWNRPILGFEEDGTPHFRIEHRVMPAGPTCSDCVANAAFYYGLVNELGRRMPQTKWEIPFAESRDNFYAAARYGLEAELEWGAGRTERADRLILDTLLPIARTGLDGLGIHAEDRDRYLGIIEARAKSGQTGAAWQRAWVARNGKDMTGLSKAYFERQESGSPVHEWSL